MDPQNMYEKRPVATYRAGRRQIIQDPVVHETPLTVIFNEQELGTLICSPYAYEELVVGFLAGEGLLQDARDIKDIYCREQQGVIWVETHSEAPPVDGFLRRNFASCCGKGRPSLYFLNDLKQVRPVQSEEQYTVSELLHLMALLEEEAQTFRLTGGVHSAALADHRGIVIRFEDIGRHNALDRILGFTLLNRVPTSNRVVILSGRIASEIVIKAARIGSPVVLSRSAPTGLALDLADQLGLTVVGFARGENLNVYCHEERIVKPFSI